MKDEDHKQIIRRHKLWGRKRGREREEGAEKCTRGTVVNEYQAILFATE